VSAPRDNDDGSLLADPLSTFAEREGQLPEIGEIELFREIILNYYYNNGRSFSWRETSDPYHILLSELMLQQTQTERAAPKYAAFLERWPDFNALSEAPFSEILILWKGLGYNRRAMALKQIALTAVGQYGGTLPHTYDELITLPMVGPATAAAILAFSFNKSALYLETNIRRVLLHFFFQNEEKVHDRELYKMLEAVQVCEDPKNWYYALMDYGVLLKKMVKNPNRRSAHYTKQTAFENSNRQIRGQILTVFTEKGLVSKKELYSFLNFPKENINKCLSALQKEGFVIPLENETAEPEMVYKINIL
jgi:A/G-specific adenine glycosylase